MKRKIEVIRSPHAGYCFGVKRAMRIIDQGIASFGVPIYTLGDVIHNPPEVARLRERGVRPVNTVTEVPEGGTLVLRAHGVPPTLLREAERRGVRILDATCPFVQRSQLLVRRIGEEGRQVIIIGDREHPEVQAVAAHASGEAIVVRNAEEAYALAPADRAGIVIQTTFSRAEAGNVIDILRQKIPDLSIHDTICEATESRRSAALELARRVDLMLVLGGRNSSNTKRLHQACAETGVRTRFVESPGEVQPSWFEGIERIGLTTGTSTPDWLIEAVLARLTALAGDAP
jgi:small subunit ribosomal protein S1